LTIIWWLESLVCILCNFLMISSPPTLLCCIVVQADKVELETNVVDEMQSQGGGDGIHRLKRYYGKYTSDMCIWK
jgi:hypothetical protein